jgi:hypothetical protein
VYMVFVKAEAAFNVTIQIFRRVNT